MAFDNHYPNRKDRRKAYVRKAERCDRSCRPHGGCPHCLSDRMANTRRREASANSRNE